MSSTACPNKLPISVVLICRNEEQNLSTLLPELAWANEIILVDNDSVDGTATCGLAGGARVLPSSSRSFAELRNQGIAVCRSEWVFMLDADERVDPELKSSLESLCTASNPAEGYRIARKNFCFGIWLQHGGFYPDFQGRIFRNGIGIAYKGVVHETLDTITHLCTLDGHIIHHPWPSLESYLNKLNHYTTLESSRRTFNKPFSAVSMATIAMATFFRMFVKKKGYRDGAIGFLICFLSGVYELVSFSKFHLDRSRDPMHQPNAQPENRH